MNKTNAQIIDSNLDCSIQIIQSDLIISNSIIKEQHNINYTLIDCNITEDIPIIEFDQFIDCRNMTIIEEVTVLKNQRNSFSGTKQMTNIKLIESFFKGLDASGDGGVVCFKFITTQIEVDFCSFVECRAGGCGGSIFTQMAKKLIVRGSCFDGISAIKGVAIYTDRTDNSENISNCFFVNCSEAKINSNMYVISSTGQTNILNYEQLNVSNCNGYGRGFILVKGEWFYGSYISFVGCTAKSFAITVLDATMQRFQFVNNTILKNDDNKSYLFYGDYQLSVHRKVYDSAFIGTELNFIIEFTYFKNTELINCTFDSSFNLSNGIVINPSVIDSNEYQPMILKDVSCYTIPQNIKIEIILGVTLGALALILLTSLLLGLYSCHKSRNDVKRQLIFTNVISDFG